MKKKGTFLRRGLSVLLSLVMVLTMLMIGLTSAAATPHSLSFEAGSPPATTPGIVFLAPEVIYLLPSAANTGHARSQFFVDQFADGTPRPMHRTHGSLMFSAPGATNVRIELVTGADAAIRQDGTRMNLTVQNSGGTAIQPAVWMGRTGSFLPDTGYDVAHANRFNGGNIGTTRNTDTVHYHLNDQTFFPQPATAGHGYLMTWRATYNICAGCANCGEAAACTALVEHTAYTFSFVFRPPLYTFGVGGTAHVQRSWTFGSGWGQYYVGAWGFGVHSVPAGTGTVPPNAEGTAGNITEWYAAVRTSGDRQLNSLLEPNRDTIPAVDRHNSNNANWSGMQMASFLQLGVASPDTTLGNRTFRYFWSSRNGTDSSAAGPFESPLARIMVDRSRYTALNQIPNLRWNHAYFGRWDNGNRSFNHGLNVNRAIFRGYSINNGARFFDTLSGAGAMAFEGPRGAAGTDFGNPNAAATRYQRLNLTWSSYTGRNATTAADGVGIALSDANFPVGETRTLRAHMDYHADIGNAMHSRVLYNLRLDVQAVDMGSLRTTFNTAVARGLQRNMFRPDAWDTYFVTLTDLAMALMRPNYAPSNALALETALNNAASLLATTVPIIGAVNATLVVNAEHMNAHNNTEIFAENLPGRFVGDTIIGRQQAFDAVGATPAGWLRNPVSGLFTADDGGTYGWVYLNQLDPLTPTTRTAAPNGTTFVATHANLRPGNVMATSAGELLWQFFYLPRIRVQFLANGGTFAGGGTENDIFYVLPAQANPPAALPIYNAPAENQGEYLRPTRPGYAFHQWRLVTVHECDASCVHVCDSACEYDCEIEYDCVGDGEIVPGAVINTAAALQRSTNHRLIAEWLPAYTLRYVLNSGTLTDTNFPIEQQVIIGVSTVPNTPIWDSEITRPNSELLHWAVYIRETLEGEFEYAGIDLLPGENPGNDITNVPGAIVELRAVWLSTRHRIEFDHNNGTGDTTVVVRGYGEQLGTLPVPELEGHRLVGWFTEPTPTVGEDEVDTTTVVGDGTLPGFNPSIEYPDNYPAVSATFYARWEPIEFTVTFNPNGTAADPVEEHGGMAPQDFVFGETQNLRTNVFTRVGFTFSGWSRSATGVVEYTPGQLVGAPPYELTTVHDDTIELFAVWTPITYTVHYNLSPADVGASGDMLFSIHQYHISQNLRANTFTRPGFAFDGWALTPGGSRAFDNQESVARLSSVQDYEFQLYARWVPLEFTIVFMDGTTEVAEESADYGQTVPVPAINPPVFAPPVGYTFGGWWTTPSGAGTKLAADGTVTTLTISSTWLSDASLADNEVATNVYVRWTPMQYPVIWDLNGGHQPSEPGNTTNVQNNQTFGSTFVLPPQPERPGYNFAGWLYIRVVDSVPELPRVINGETIVNTTTLDPLTIESGIATTMIARWIWAGGFAVRYELEGGTIEGNGLPVLLEVPIGSVFAIPEFMPNEPIKTGHNFLGWFSMPQYDCAECENDGSACTDCEDMRGVQIDVGDTLTEALIANLDDHTVPSVFYAHWAPVVYNLVFDLDGGNIAGSTTNPTDSLVFGENITLPTPDPTRIGFVFDGWLFTDSSGSTEIYDGMELTRYILASLDNAVTTIYVAQWIPIDYTVIFELEGGNIAGSTVNPTDTVNFGDYFELPDEPSRYGYRFEGWFTLPGGEGDEITDTTEVGEDNINYNVYDTSGSEPYPLYPTVFYAHWVARTFTLTFDPQGGTPNRTSQVITFNAPLGAAHLNAAQEPTLATVERAGHNFEGWFTLPRGHEDEALAEQVFAADVLDAEGSFTVYAWWTAREFTLTFECPHATPDPLFINTTFGQPFGPLADISRSGYVFEGWFVGALRIDENSVHNVDGNMTATARWRARAFVFDFIGNGGTPDTESVNQVFDALVRFPTTLPTMDGQMLIGWNTADDGSGVDIDATTRVTTAILNPLALADTVANSDIPTRIYAQWAPIVFNLVFDLQGGNINNDTSDIPATVAFGERYDEALGWPTQTPVRDDYVFVGWYTSPDATTGRIIGSMLVPNTLTPPPGYNTLYARWRPVDHSPYHVQVHLEDENGNFSLYQSMEYFALQGSRVERESGYWADAFFVFDDTQPNVMFTYVNEDGTATIVLHYRRIMVALYVDLGSNDASISVNPAGQYRWGQEIDVVNPTRTGWRFVGWNVAGLNAEVDWDDGDEYATLTMGRTTTTITAQWEVAQHAINLFANNRSINVDNEFPVELGLRFDHHAPFPETATIDNYWHFIGWSQNGGESFITGANIVTRIEPIDAIFVRVYEVTYDALEGEIVGGGQITPRRVWFGGRFGEAIDGVPNAERDEHHFMGWFLQHNGATIEISGETIVPQLTTQLTHNPDNSVLNALGAVGALSDGITSASSVAVIEARWYLYSVNPPEPPDEFPWWILLLLGIPAAIITLVGLILGPVLMILAWLVPGRLFCWAMDNCDPDTVAVQVQQPLQGTVEQLIEVTQANSMVWSFSLLMLLLAGGVLTWILLRRRKQSKMSGN